MGKPCGPILMIFVVECCNAPCQDITLKDLMAKDIIKKKLVLGCLLNQIQISFLIFLE